MTIKEKREEIGLSRAKMARLFEIPIRTLEDWDSGVRRPPAWAEKLILKELDNIGKELKMFTISLEEWEKLEWFDSGISYTHYTPECLWENDYNVVREFKIDETNCPYPEYVFQKDGQLYIQRGKLAKVYNIDNKLFAGEKQSEIMPDLWEEKMYSTENTGKEIDFKIRVRKDGIAFCHLDKRLYNFLKKNGLVIIRDYGLLKYMAADSQNLDIFKMAVEKYSRYTLVYQLDKSVEVTKTE